jgi:hypothetical protein
MLSGVESGVKKEMRKKIPPKIPFKAGPAKDTTIRGNLFFIQISVVST